MTGLQTIARIDAPDEFYEALIQAHRGLTDAQSEMLNARLVLLLANHVGDMQVLREALAAARDGLAVEGPVVDGPGAEEPGAEGPVVDGSGAHADSHAPRT